VSALEPAAADEPHDGVEAPQPAPERTPYASPDRSAAFFDLDRTLISGASAFLFGAAAWRAGLVPSRVIARDAASALRFRLTGATDAQVVQARDRVLHAITGNRQADLAALNATIIPKLLDEVRPEARKLLDLHRKAGRDTYIVSATPIEIVEPLATALGMTGGIGTVAEVVDGRYTGALIGSFCYGPGKVDAIGEIAAWEGYDLARCYAYSDSASDLPMLELVGHPVAVNPDGPLERLAHERGWPIVIFSRRTRTVARRTTAALGGLAVAGGSFAAGIAVGRHRPS
jgi:HAD superfamily hydrolase (TIGR01490 family)